MCQDAYSLVIIAFLFSEKPWASEGGDHASFPYQCVLSTYTVLDTE